MAMDSVRRPGEPVEGQEVRDAIHDAVIAQLRGGQVDRDVDVLHLRSVAAPGGELADGFLRDPVADL
jgi:hypothetical protein